MTLGFEIKGVYCSHKCVLDAEEKCAKHKAGSKTFY